MKKILALLLMIIVGLVGCEKKVKKIIDNSNESIEDTTIVVYFSATNNTKRVAEAISDSLNCRIFELEPVNAYTSADLNYSSSSSRVSIEHNDPNRHVELKNTSIEGFENLKYIFIGAPVWWQELSWVINDFLINNSFSGKTIIPFGTSASSDFKINNLKKLAPDANWANQKRFSQSLDNDSVNSWLKDLGFKN